jgi:hypothetical protein
MYSYQNTETIEAGPGRLTELKARLDSRGPLPRIWLGRRRRELEAEAVAAPTSMEGVAVTVDEVRRILAGDRPSSVARQGVAFVEGYRDAMKFVLHRADDPQFASDATVQDPGKRSWTRRPGIRSHPGLLQSLWRRLRLSSRFRPVWEVQS